MHEEGYSSPTMRRSRRKTRVMHVISSWAMGGTERMLTHLIPHCDQERFVSRLVCFNRPSSLSEEWRAAGIDLIHLNSDRRVSITGMVRLARELGQWRPDVLMSYGLRASLMARVAAWWRRVPVVVTGQRGIEDWKRWYHVLLEKLTSPMVDLYIGNSKACCEMLRCRERIPSRKLEVIPNGISFRRSSATSEQWEYLQHRHKIPKDAVVVGSVGRLQPVKGHEVLIASACEVLRKYPNAFFVIVGQDHRDGELQEQVRRADIEERCCFPGYSRDVSAWLEGMDIFVLPSHSEGMPVAALEAMFMRLPVVATRVGGTPEVVLDGETGILVPPGDAHSMAMAICRLVEDVDLRSRLADAGKHRAEEEFTVELMVRRYEDTLTRLVQRKCGASHE